MSFIKWVIRHPWLVLTTVLGMLGASWSYKHQKKRRAKVEAKIEESKKTTALVLMKNKEQTEEIIKEIEVLDAQEKVELESIKVAETKALSALERRKKILEEMKS